MGNLKQMGEVPYLRRQLAKLRGREGEAKRKKRKKRDGDGDEMSHSERGNQCDQSARSKK